MVVTTERDVRGQGGGRESQWQNRDVDEMEDNIGDEKGRVFKDSYNISSSQHASTPTVSNIKYT